MSDGIGCKCGASARNECYCDEVDWRSAREVELETTVGALAEQRRRKYEN